ncbi:spore coat protein [Alicyclobacillus dauci]|uniref:Spore coat protein n=1 Tax=Alicyclobacillus dauci TaxID=1475485 RepID=A0ABY6ZBH5_9BACL|nr:spore coat protein [Alicyclobacillus dauci]WAH39455.1 spore coat protein [Alicyclobacillus dauci]
MNQGMDLDLQNFTNMIELADQSIALEFLLTVKSGIRNYAISLTEIATPEARTVIHNQLNQGLEMHGKLSKLMVSKGWLHPYDPNEQFQLDIKSARVTEKVANMPLFHDRASIIEKFDTPQKSN